MGLGDQALGGSRLWGEATLPRSASGPPAFARATVRMTAEGPMGGEQRRLGRATIAALALALAVSCLSILFVSGKSGPTRSERTLPAMTEEARNGHALAAADREPSTRTNAGSVDGDATGLEADLHGIKACHDDAPKQARGLEPAPLDSSSQDHRWAGRLRGKAYSTELLEALRTAVAEEDVKEIHALLEQVPRDDPALVDGLKAMVVDTGGEPDLRRYAAEGLMRLGTVESVSFVLDQLLVAYSSGDTDQEERLRAALGAPTTVDGARVLIDALLGLGNYAAEPGTLPIEVASAIRKAVLAVPEQGAVGEILAELYRDRSISTNHRAVWELDEMSHPAMLARLALRAYRENHGEDWGLFLDRLSHSDQPGAVRAMVELVSEESVPLEQVATALYNWTRQHPREATPGLFLEYVTDSTRPAEQRAVAALGLAGAGNPEEARIALEKVLGSEPDPVLGEYVRRVLRSLNQEQAR